MANIKATNNFCFIVRDEAAETEGELWLPESGRKKPSKGTIVSVGDLVKDKNIKAAKGKKCLFHAGVGWPLKHDGIEYLVLEGEHIIGLP